MKAKNEKPVVPSLDEIVFENRNKEYGAYTLRKKYNKSLLLSMLLGTFFIGATVITPYALYKPAPPTDKPKYDSIHVEFTSVNLLANQKIEQPKPDVVKPPVLDYNKIQVVDTLSPDEANKFLSQEDLKDSIKDQNIGPLVVVSQTPEVEPDPEEKINEIFRVNEPPCFGTECDNGFRIWITKNIVYPVEAIERGIQGRVYMKFVVEKDGSLSHIEVVRSIDPILSKEAVRVLEMSPNWNPGKINGTPVRVRMFFPITFALNIN